MGKKYIIELLDDCPSEFKGIIVFGLTPDGQIAAEPIPVEDLTPYTEPDLEQVRKEAYEKGRKDVEMQFCSYDACKNRQEEYQRGLADAWETARTLWNTPNRKEIFGNTTFNTVLTTLTAQETIEKIRQYEQEKRFCVGDEFENESGKRFVITKMDGTEIDRYIDEEGKTYCMIAKYKVIRKTGRHFPEIAEILAKMKESANEN